MMKTGQNKKSKHETNQRQRQMSAVNPNSLKLMERSRGTQQYVPSMRF